MHQFAVFEKRCAFPVLLGIFMVSLLCALAVSLPAYALPNGTVSGAFSDYKIEAYHNGADDSDQHVRLTFYNSSITAVNSVTAKSSIFGDSPTCAITIAGRDISSSSYFRDATVSGGSGYVTVDIGQVLERDEESEEYTSAFTAQYSGVIVVNGYLCGVSGYNEESTFPVSVNTVIPTGFALDISGEGTNELSISVANNAQVRGMIHLGIYTGAEENGAMVYTPICESAGTIEAFTYTIHAHQFQSMTAADYISAISALSLPSDYSVDNPTSTTLTITGPSDSALYMGVYDDDMLQAMGLTFSGRNTGTGELNPDGSAAS